MRIKNKEIRQRRHRKEKVIKAAQKELREKYASGKPAGSTSAAAAEKPAAKPKAPAKKAEGAAKPKKAPAKKKTEEAPAE